MSSLNAFSTIVRPVVSEKSTVLGELGKYVFEVAPDANKIQIKHAIEEVFANKKVQVLTVNILRVPGKERRRGRSVGMTRSWKKAIVTLRAGQRLDLFEGV
ncbi:MAG TPA: 50S ribosomal protein L23 [Chloroflexota bacterium]|nr:50S ribosomal protein L23 [Chloroflexota bacterium]